jgi:hypothetical protein
MIDGEREAWEEWDDEATFPICAFTLCAKDAMENRIAYPIFNNHVLHGRPVLSIKTELRA